MHRDENSHIESAGQDSFLDVTTNVVGILIVLVMVVAMRTQNPVTTTTAPEPNTEELTKLKQRAAQLDYETRRAGDEIDALNREADQKATEREALATIIAAGEKEIGDRRAKLDAAAQEEFDLRRQLDAGREAIDRESSELDSLEHQPEQVEVVKHYPTPIARTVLGHEVHFQLLDGKISWVPIDDFIDDVRADMRGSNLDINHISDRVGVVGPRNGFEFRYTVDLVMQPGRGAVGIRAKEFQIVPVSLQQGETVDRALSSHSEFRSALAAHNPRDTTVTLWTYPDSFESYRKIKEELHNMGYATAGRPLPKGVLIGGSDHGTRSSAQ